MTTADQAGHDLLVTLAGRLPDEVLWRLRDWLAAQAHGPLAAMLPRELLRHRLGLTDVERDLLVASAGEWGASRRELEEQGGGPAGPGRRARRGRRYRAACARGRTAR